MDEKKPPPDPERMSLQGQWVGKYAPASDPSASKGSITLDLDGHGNEYAGSCRVLEDHAAGGMVGVYAVALSRKGRSVSGTGALRYFAQRDAASLIFVPPGEQNYEAEGRSFGRTLRFNGTAGVHDATSTEMKLQWETSLPLKGEANVLRVIPGLESEVRRTVVTWSKFKSAVGAEAHQRLIYRGQSSPHRLRTAFHRAGRADILKFDEDMRDVRNATSGVLSYLFDTANPESYAGLMALAQHHGYPTPLLDWTHSPYIAAYFAVKGVVDPSKKLRPRVYAFNFTGLYRHQGAATAISTPRFTVTALSPLPLHNPRLLPQQSIVTFSNIDDIEGYLHYVQKTYGHQIIHAYDIDDDPAHVLADLRLMGIHAGSLFPGLDGACQSLTEKNFLRPPEPAKEETPRAPEAAPVASK